MPNAFLNLRNFSRNSKGKCRTETHAGVSRERSNSSPTVLAMPLSLSPPLVLRYYDKLRITFWDDLVPPLPLQLVKPGDRVPLMELPVTNQSL